MTLERIGDRIDHSLVGEHAQLDRADAKIIEAGIDLRAQESHGRHVHCRHAARVLGGECGNRGKAVQPMRSEGLEIGLNAGATARIGTGNSKNAERASVGKRHEFTIRQGMGDHNANRNGAGFVRHPIQIIARGCV